MGPLKAGCLAADSTPVNETARALPPGTSDIARRLTVRVPEADKRIFRRPDGVPAIGRIGKVFQ